MITIKGYDTITKPNEMLLEDLCKSYSNRATEQAFIGRCGDGPEHSLYIIGYDFIFLAGNPTQSWTSPLCPVVIDRFVDLEITIKEKP